MSRRKWSSRDKLMIVLEGLKGKVPLGELCAKFQISRSQYYKWRDSAAGGLNEKRPPNQDLGTKYNDNPQ